MTAQLDLFAEPVNTKPAPVQAQKPITAPINAPIPHTTATQKGPKNSPFAPKSFVTYRSKRYQVRFATPHEGHISLVLQDEDTGAAGPFWPIQVKMFGGVWKYGPWEVTPEGHQAPAAASDQREAHRRLVEIAGAEGLNSPAYMEQLAVLNAAILRGRG